MDLLLLIDEETHHYALSNDFKIVVTNTTQNVLAPSVESAAISLTFTHVKNFTNAEMEHVSSLRRLQL